MSDRPILDIQLDTSAFEVFRAKFDAFRAKTAEASGAWADVGKTTTAAAQTFDKLAARLAKMHEALAGIQAKTEASGEEQAASSDNWTHIASSAKVFSANVQDASLSLAKWSGLTGLFAGILSAGGLYGISRMAAGVGARRSGAMSYGLGYGEFQSYQTNFAWTGNPGGLLNGFNNALTNAEDRAPLYALMGANADKRLAGKNAAEALVEALPDIKRFVDNTDPRNLEGMLHGTGLDRLGVDTNTALIFRGTSPQKIAEHGAEWLNDSVSMNLSPEIAQKWQDFETTLDEAGSEIENHFAVNLVNLTPGLTRLADATSDLVDHMLKDGGPAEKWLKKVNSGVEGFAGKIGSKDSLAAVDKFVKNVSDVGSVIGQIITKQNPLMIAIAGAEYTAKVGSYVFGGDADADTRSWIRRHNPFAADYKTKMDYYKKYGGPKPVDDDAEDAKRWDRYKKQNATEDAAERAYQRQRAMGGADNLSKGRGMTGLRAAAGISPSVVPENADQSTWGANYGYLKNHATGGATRPGEIDALHPVQAAKMAEMIRWTHDNLGVDIGILSAARRNGQTGSIFDSQGKSLHPEGLAGDFNLSGLSAGQYDAFARHAGKIGLYRPWNSGSERNHWQIVPDRHAAQSFNAVDLPRDERLRRQNELYPINPGDPEGKLSPIHPHHAGQTNTVHVDDETSHAYVSTNSRSVGPMSYGTDFGRFSH